MFESYFKMHFPYFEMHHIPNLLDHYLYTRTLCKDLGYLILFERTNTLGVFIPKGVSEEQLGYFEKNLYLRTEKEQKKMVAFQLKRNEFHLLIAEDALTSWVKVYAGLQENYQWGSLTLQKKKEGMN